MKEYIPHICAYLWKLTMCWQNPANIYIYIYISPPQDTIFNQFYATAPLQLSMRTLFEIHATSITTYSAQRNLHFTIVNNTR